MPNAACVWLVSRAKHGSAVLVHHGALGSNANGGGYAMLQIRRQKINVFNDGALKLGLFGIF